MGLIQNDSSDQLQHIYGGLDQYNRCQFDIIARRSIWTKITHEIIVLLEKVSGNDRT